MARPRETGTHRERPAALPRALSLTRRRVSLSAAPEGVSEMALRAGHRPTPSAAGAPRLPFLHAHREAFPLDEGSCLTSPVDSTSFRHPHRIIAAKRRRRPSRVLPLGVDGCSTVPALAAVAKLGYALPGRTLMFSSTRPIPCSEYLHRYRICNWNPSESRWCDTPRVADAARSFRETWEPKCPGRAASWSCFSLQPWLP